MVVIAPASLQTIPKSTKTIIGIFLGLYTVHRNIFRPVRCSSDYWHAFFRRSRLKDDLAAMDSSYCRFFPARFGFGTSGIHF
jgi:hypothetical protein